MKTKNQKLPSWKQKSTFEKAVTMLGLIISIVIVTLSSLNLAGVCECPIYVTMPLCVVMILLQALQFRKYDSVVTAVSLGAAVLIFFVFINILLS